MVRGHNSRGKTIAVLQPARDSVFRQILFKLGKDRGKMRVLLDLQNSDNSICTCKWRTPVVEGPP
ncbi:MAG: hypothetical protein WCR59_06185 [Planctomycetota bacterium]